MRRTLQSALHYLDLRFVVMASAIWWLFSAPLPSASLLLDNLLFSATQSIKPLVADVPKIEVLTLNRSEWQQLWQDPTGSNNTIALIQQLPHVRAQVGFLFNDTPVAFTRSAENLLTQPHLAQTHHTALLAQAWQSRQSTERRFHEWLDSPWVSLGHANLQESDLLPAQILVQPPKWPHPNSWMPHHLFLPKFAHVELEHLFTPRLLENRRFLLQPTQQSKSLSVPLIWPLEKEWHKTFALELFQKKQKWNHWIWEDHERLSASGAQSIAVNNDGTVIIAKDTHYSSHIRQHSLGAFLRLNDLGEVVLIGEEGDERLMHSAHILHALSTGQHSASPWWQPLLEKMLILVLLAYVLWGVPRVAGSMGALISIVFVGAMIGFQVFWQHYHQEWMPLARISMWLILAHLVMWIWRQQKKPAQALIKHHQEVATQWAEQLILQGQLDAAKSALKQCVIDEKWLQLMYEMGGQHERKRRPGAALDIYREISAHKSRYKDVKKRIEQLEQKQNPVTDSSAETLAKTVVLSDPHSRPQFGRYQIERELGRGAMGVVYLGFDPQISRKVAIKTLEYAQYEHSSLTEIKTRFFKEAEAAGRLRHPNIVSVYDVGEEHDLAYITMDYVVGQPLSDFVSAGNLLPVADVYDIMAEVAEALHYAHEEKVIHRDIKPGNIMYHTDKKQVTVTDFGIARIVNEQRTQTGDVMGSPLYMSPEQITGKKVGRTTDIFSLGVTFFQLLTGELPFAGDNIAELSQNILNGKPRNVKEFRDHLPSSAKRIINKALQKDPSERYRDAAEMAKAFRNGL